MSPNRWRVNSFVFTQKGKWLWPGCSCHSPFLPISSIQSVVSLGARQATSFWHCAKDFAIGRVQSWRFFSGHSPELCRLHNAHLHVWPSTHQTKVSSCSTNIRWVFKEVRNKLTLEFQGNEKGCWKLSHFGTLGSDDMGDTVRGCMVWNYMGIWLVQVTKFCPFGTRKLSKPGMIHPKNTLLNPTTSTVRHSVAQ